MDLVTTHCGVQRYNSATALEPTAEEQFSAFAPVCELRSTISGSPANALKVDENEDEAGNIGSVPMTQTAVRTVGPLSACRFYRCLRAVAERPFPWPVSAEGRCRRSVIPCNATADLSNVTYHPVRYGMIHVYTCLWICTITMCNALYQVAILYQVISRGWPLDQTGSLHLRWHSLPLRLLLLLR